MRTRDLFKTTAVSAAVVLTGSGLAYAGATTTTPTVASTDGANDSAVVASHANHKHGGQAGHLPGTSKDLRLVGQMKINQDREGRVADVAILKDHAYLAAFNDGDCQKGGVYVFDIRDKTAPKQINFIRAANNSYVGEGAQAITLKTPSFTGDLLLHNNETCTGGGNAGGTDQSVGGVSLVDVSNPKSHKYLAKGFGDTSTAGGKAHTVHSAFAWQPSTEKAYAVLVDNEESTDIDIADITDPRNPKIIAEYDLDAGTKEVGGVQSASGIPPVADPVKGASESFLHDMVVKEIGGKQVMLASYWDGGYVKLDVTDPTAARYLADSDFAAVDEELLESTGDSREPEGNAHQAEFNKGSTRILAADEDFSPFSLTASYQTAEGVAVPFETNSGDGTVQLQPGEKLTGPTTFVGRACPGDPAVPAGGAGVDIAVVERGVCDFTVKVAAVSAAGGWDGVLIVNRTGSDACSDTLGMSVTGDLKTFGVSPRELAYDLFPETKAYDEAACRADSPAGTQTLPIALGATGLPVTVESYFDGWGYLRLFENNDGKLTQLDTHAIDEAHQIDKATGFGDLSVHEVAFSEKDPNIAYVSYYAGGTRVYDISSGEIVEVARHIDADGSNVWGVQVFQDAKGNEFVAASDRDYGLQIFEYAPVNG